MEADSGLAAIRGVMSEEYGRGSARRFEELCNIAALSQPCDICTRSNGKYLDAKIHIRLLSDIQKISENSDLIDYLERIPVLTGEGTEVTVSFTDIVALYPMPYGGISEEGMRQADLADGDEDGIAYED